MIACNIAAHRGRHLPGHGLPDAGGGAPVNRRLFGQPVGLWCINDDTVPSNTRVGYGGKTEWRKLTASPDNWLYCCKVDLELLMSPNNLMERNPIDELDHGPAPVRHGFYNAVAMGGSQACAMDNAKTRRSGGPASSPWCSRSEMCGLMPGSTTASGCSSGWWPTCR